MPIQAQLNKLSNMLEVGRSVVGTLITPGALELPSPWFMRHLTRCCAAFSSTAVAGEVAGLQSTSFNVTFEGQLKFTL